MWRVPNTAEPSATEREGGEEAVAGRSRSPLLDKILVYAMLSWMSVATSLGSVGFVITGIIEDYGVADQNVKALLGSSSLIGMFIGALTSGFIGDRIGRRKSAVLYAVLHGLSGIVAALAYSPAWFIVFRIITGIGLGGLLPVVVSMVSEYSAPANRGRRVSILESSWAYGWLIPVVIAYFGLGRLGWRNYSLLTSIVAFLLALSSTALPESPRYLLLIGRRNEARRLAMKHGVPLPEVRGAGEPWFRSIRRLFSGDLLPVTLGLWLIWFTITMGYYGVFIWYPKLLASHGAELGYGPLAEYLASRRLEYLLITTLAQIPGYYSAAYLVDKIGRKKTLGVYLVLTGVSALFLSMATTVPLFLLMGITLSFFDLGAWASLYTYTPEQYPTGIRVAGTAWASTIGRLGGILGPYIVPFLGSWYNVFLFFSLIHLIGAVGVVAGRELKGLEMVE